MASEIAALLHFDAADGSASMVDETGRAWSPKNGAKITATQSKFGGSSLYLNSDSMYIESADSDAFEFGSADFTIEGFIRFSNYGFSNDGLYTQCFVSKDTSGSGKRGFALNFPGTSSAINQMMFIGFDSDATYTIISESFSFALNTWYFVEACRADDKIYLFVDGILLNAGGTSFPITIQNTTSTVKIGANMFDSTYKYSFRGWIDEVRITKGLARHTADYSPPTVPFGLKNLSLSGTIDESLAVGLWHVRSYRIDDGELTASVDTADGTFILEIGDNDDVPHMVTVSPNQGVPWLSLSLKIIGNLVYPVAPNTTPYYYKATVAGTTGSTEPTWPTIPGHTVTDGTVTWECVERLVQPITHSPLIPV